MKEFGCTNCQTGLEVPSPSPSPSLFQTGEMPRGPWLEDCVDVLPLLARLTGVMHVTTETANDVRLQPTSRDHFNDYRRDDRCTFAASRPGYLPSKNHPVVMAAPGGASLPHRAVSSIRGGAAPSGESSSANPRTPTRSTPSIPSQFNSPSSLRAEDDVLIIEFGSRRLRAGFAGDAVPKALVSFSPAQTRRVGDLRAWEVGYVDDWARGPKWAEEYELWRNDVRGLDLGLVGDRMERGLREAFNKCGHTSHACPFVLGSPRLISWST